MVINLDLAQLLKNNLTIEEYCLICIYYYKLDYSILVDFIVNPDYTHQELVKKEYLKNDEELNAFILTNKSIKLFDKQEKIDNITKYFLEFWSNYPIKVNDGLGGIRVLRSKDENSKQGKDCLNKYLKIVNTKETHDEIMLGLKNYLENHTRSDKQRFIVGIEVFLNKHLWQSYLDITDKSNNLSDKTESI